MYTLKVKNAKGELYELTHSPESYYVIGITGLTPPPTVINTAVSGMVDGSFFNSSRLEQRNIVVTIVLNGDIESNRERIYKIFNLRKACTLFFSNKNRSVKINGYVEAIESDLFSIREQVQVSLICPRPYFEDVESTFYELSEIAKLFQFPFFINENNLIPFSEIQTTPSVTVFNNGDVECGVKITVNFSDNVNTLTISNATTNEYIGINNLFPAGSELTINTKSGELSATLNYGGVEFNMLNYLTEGSTWFKLSPGANIIAYTVTSGLSAVNAVIEVVSLYGGV